MRFGRFSSRGSEAELTELRGASTRLSGLNETGYRCIPKECSSRRFKRWRALGDRLRLAQVRGETERPAAVHHRDRRLDIHPSIRSKHEMRCDTLRPRMARLGHRQRKIIVR